MPLTHWLLSVTLLSPVCNSCGCPPTATTPVDPGGRWVGTTPAGVLMTLSLSVGAGDSLAGTGDVRRGAEPRRELSLRGRWRAADSNVQLVVRGWLADSVVMAGHVEPARPSMPLTFAGGRGAEPATIRFWRQ